MVMGSLTNTMNADSTIRYGKMLTLKNLTSGPESQEDHALFI